MEQQSIKADAQFKVWPARAPQYMKAVLCPQLTGFFFVPQHLRCSVFIIILRRSLQLAGVSSLCYQLHSCNSSPFLCRFFLQDLLSSSFLDRAGRSCREKKIFHHLPAARVGFELYHLFYAMPQVQRARAILYQTFLPRKHVTKRKYWAYLPRRRQTCRGRGRACKTRHRSSSQQLRCQARKNVLI